MRPSPVPVLFKRLTPGARVPSYATPGSACMDLFPDASWPPNPPWQYLDDAPLVIPTGLAVQLPDDHVLLIFSRSGHGFKYGIRLGNCVGVIDSDYRGEIKVCLRIDTALTGGWPDEFFDPSRAIAQALLLPIPRMTLQEVEDLNRTYRGTSGFGSTGG